jgi:uncharacterized protein YcbK (DUF882 family)
MAADIVIVGVKPWDIAAFAELLLPTSGGIGLYDYAGGFVHVDVREKRARWLHKTKGGPEIGVAKFE